jgi:hypothetical protein
VVSYIIINYNPTPSTFIHVPLLSVHVFWLLGYLQCFSYEKVFCKSASLTQKQISEWMLMVINYTWTRPIGQFNYLYQNWFSLTSILILPLHLLDLQCRHIYAILTESRGQMVSIPTSYSGQPGSNLGVRPATLRERILWCFSVPPGRCWGTTSIRPRPLPPTFSSINHWSITLLRDEIS